MESGRLVALDGLRGIAAICVMLMHLHFQDIALHGYLAVDLFFILSGFVIARSYEPALRGGMEFRRYVQIRLARLYPLLFLGSLVGVAVFVAGFTEIRLTDSEFVIALVAQFTLIPYLAHGIACVFNGPQWTISYELLANFVHALFLKWLSNAMVLAIMALSAAGIGLGIAVNGNANLGFHVHELPYALARVGFGFFAGVLLYRLREQWDRHVPQLGLIVPALILLLVINAPHAWTPSHFLFGALDLVSILLVFPVLVMMTAKARAGRIAEHLGVLSFPLYVIHEPLILAAQSVDAGMGTIAGLSAILIPTAWAIGRWIDEPLNRWRRQRTKAATPPRSCIGSVSRSTQESSAPSPQAFFS